MELYPLGDLNLIRNVGNELDEFIDMYYWPYITALFDTNVDSSPVVKDKYFIAHR